MARDDQRDHFDAPERHGHAGQRVRALRCETNLARPRRLSCAEAHEAPPQTRILEVLAEAVRVVSSALVRTHDSLAVAGCKYAGGRALMAWAREPRIYLPIPVLSLFLQKGCNHFYRSSTEREQGRRVFIPNYPNPASIRLRYARVERACSLLEVGGTPGGLDPPQ